MGKIYKNGIQYSGTTDAATNINYDNSKGAIKAGNVQGAIDEIMETTSQSRNLTQAEYDALPDTKYTDNIEYFITDAEPLDASTIAYDNTTSKMTATNVQAGIDELNSNLTQTEAKINNVDEHLTAENNMPFRFAFDTNSGKYGYITESGGADTFNPFSDGSVGEFDTFVKRIVGSATNQYQTYKFDVEEGANYLFTLYTLHPSGGGRIRKITGGSYEILAGRYVSDTEVTNAYTPACIIHAESTVITIEAVMGMSEIYLTPYACLYKLT